MGAIKTLLEAFGIFAVSILILLVYDVLTRPRHVATGVADLNMKGPLLIYVGLFYAAFGVFLFLYRR